MRIFTLLLLFILQSCGHLFYQPSRDEFYHPRQFKLSYEDVHFQAKDGTKLHGWFLASQVQPVKGTIVHFHGNAQNITTHFLNLSWLVKQGFNIFIFDYRGYGKSEGKASQEGLYQDALAALKKGKELHNTQGKFIVYGQSLGGIVSLRALADYPDLSKVDLIVMDSTFDSYRDIAFDKLTSRWFLYPVSPLALVAVSDAYAADEIFEKIKTPTLVIVGLKDSIIPAKFGKRIYKGIDAQEKWLWKLPMGRHIDVFHGPNESYRSDFLKLVDSLDRK
jgi:fermentation-respiration switch protein FrsA (DUF1100 family)